MSEAKLSLLAYLNACWSQVFTDLSFPEKGTAQNFSWHPSRFLVLTPAKAEAWQSLLGHATAADSCLLYILSCTGLLVDP